MNTNELVNDGFNADFEVITPSDAAAKVATLPTMAAKIRALLATGMTRGAVAKALGIKYQWVRNVEIQPLKRQ